jgi:hypothetical protein
MPAQNAVIVRSTAWKEEQHNKPLLPGLKVEGTFAANSSTQRDQIAQMFTSSRMPTKRPLGTTSAGAFLARPRLNLKVCCSIQNRRRLTLYPYLLNVGKTRRDKHTQLLQLRPPSQCHVCDGVHLHFMWDGRVW